ncbi:ABC transporter G family member 20-like [Curcuma longa]|uniref:ABC transporter G family member 20-like n=1 Tax=Curcuma longa TaxID=136217 RepID=UPI003D9DF42E
MELLLALRQGSIFVNQSRIHDYQLWFHMSLVKYLFKGVIRNEFDDPPKCFMRGLQMFDNKLLGTLPDSENDHAQAVMGVNITSNTCINTGNGILQQHSITQLSKWGITIARRFVFRFLFSISLLLGSRNRR